MTVVAWIGASLALVLGISLASLVVIAVLFRLVVAYNAHRWPEVRDRFRQEHEAATQALQRRRQTSSGLFYYVDAPPDDIALWRDFLNERERTWKQMQ